MTYQLKNKNNENGIAAKKRKTVFDSYSTLTNVNMNVIFYAAAHVNVTLITVDFFI